MSGRLPSAETIARLTRRQENVQFHEDGNLAEVEFPGLPTNAFDRLGKPRMDYVAKVLEVSRTIHLKDIDTLIDSKGNLLVVSSQTWSFTPEFYKTMANSTPYKGLIKRASFSDRVICHDFDLFDQVTGTLLLRSTRRISFVNKAGQGVAHSDSFKSKLMKAGLKQVVIPCIPQPAPPSDCYVYHVVVAASDMDHLYHVNQSSYLTYCLDAAYQAGMAGKLPQFPDDIAGYDLKEAGMVYRAQAVAGDKLEVQVWEDQGAPHILHFLTSRQGHTVNMATLSYYGDQAKL